MNTQKIKPGDWVQIANGDWYEVHGADNRYVYQFIYFDDCTTLLCDLPSLITDHKTAAEYAEMQRNEDVPAMPSDTEMLDWLEETYGTCGWGKTYIGYAFYAHADTQGDKYNAAETLRQAIAAAMQVDQSANNDGNGLDCEKTARKESEVGE